MRMKALSLIDDLCDASVVMIHVAAQPDEMLQFEFSFGVIQGAYAQGEPGLQGESVKTAAPAGLK